jgi:hypothetical protein
MVSPVNRASAIKAPIGVRMAIEVLYLRRADDVGEEARDSEGYMALTRYPPDQAVEHMITNGLVAP